MPTTPTPARRGRALRRLVMGVLLLLVVLVAADRGAAYLASSRISDELRARLAATAQPTVSISGFPLLAQAAAGSYERVRILAPGVAAGDLDRVDVDLTLREVRLALGDALAGDVSGGTVGDATADITIPEASLSHLTGLPIKIDGITEQVARLSTTFQVLGAKVPVSIDAKVVVKGAQARLDVQAARAGGVALPGFVISSLAKAIGLTFAVPTLVEGMHLDAVSSRYGAIVLHASGTDVPFPAG
ncbi:LmeA family phospholipid-binding protein [Cumulibacter manganitolerans]|uniref:LmeA family phospholipid-binding protein n=1 Tax=Cumulibacter manganitolerans TaxID=1884992 RepID=UPI00129493BB|nr:DUF2993 domain-containing protein [Cumulibacter manganitolerans]